LKFALDGKRYEFTAPLDRELRRVREFMSQSS
jgi:hypothetical protein